MAIRRKEASYLNFTLFPALASPRYNDLHSLYANMDWMQGLWETIHWVTDSLLWSLHDVSVASRFGGSVAGHEAVVSATKKLPVIILRVLLFELTSRARILQTAGAEPTKYQFCPEDLKGRAHVELCLKEILLKQGTDLFVDLLPPGSRRDQSVEKVKGRHGGA